MPYVYSTASQSTDFAVYAETNNRELSSIIRKITINGGANVATKYPNLYTPLGMMTQVSDEDLAFLENDYSFKEMVKNGFLTVDKRKVEVEKVITGLKPKDKSAPRTPQDPEFQNAGAVVGENTSTKGITYAGVKKAKK